VKANLEKLGVWSLMLLTSIPPAIQAENAGNVQILSATVRDQKIGGATVILQKNGEQSSSILTNQQGQAPLNESAAGDPAALLIVRKEGYSDLVAKCPCAGMTYAISPVMESLDAMRIVLNWGASPDDLDGHLAYPGNHVWFSSKSGADATLDVDQTHGYGPETVTITRKHDGERYIYAVQDFSDKREPGSSALSRSDAKVFVYVGQTLVRSYYVPQNKDGNLWTVFAVSATGEIQDINTMTGISAMSSADLTADRVFGAGSANGDRVASISTPAPAAPIPDSARQLNTRGESAYRAGDYASAIRLFQAAIEQSDRYGQAYSNLGLAFQKSGRVAEALWANRKAIALASGPSAMTTRAGTHFNNGRIYEEARQWNDALREFKAARSEKSNPVYDEAIERVHGKGAQ
jgi:Tetratricopeptide repeat